MSETSPAASLWRYREISVGMKAEHEYVISPALYDHFLAAFGDRSPIHVDPAYAQACGFPGKVMHGALLNGFVSHFVGMHFPGRLSLLLAADLRFAQPSFLGDVILLEAAVAQKLDARQVIVLDAIFKNTTRDCLAGRGRIQVMMREEP